MTKRHNARSQPAYLLLEPTHDLLAPYPRCFRTASGFFTLAPRLDLFPCFGLAPSCGLVISRVAGGGSGRDAVGGPLVLCSPLLQALCWNRCVVRRLGRVKACGAWICDIRLVREVVLFTCATDAGASARAEAGAVTQTHDLSVGVIGALVPPTTLGVWPQAVFVCRGPHGWNGCVGLFAKAERYERSRSKDKLCCEDDLGAKASTLQK